MGQEDDDGDRAGVGKGLACCEEHPFAVGSAWREELEAACSVAGPSGGGLQMGRRPCGREVTQVQCAGVDPAGSPVGVGRADVAGGRRRGSGRRVELTGRFQEPGREVGLRDVMARAGVRGAEERRPVSGRRRAGRGGRRRRWWARQCGARPVLSGGRWGTVEAPAVVPGEDQADAAGGRRCRAGGSPLCEWAGAGGYRRVAVAHGGLRAGRSGRDPRVTAVVPISGREQVPAGRGVVTEGRGPWGFVRLWGRSARPPPSGRSASRGRLLRGSCGPVRGSRQDGLDPPGEVGVLLDREEAGHLGLGDLALEALTGPEEPPPGAG